MTSEEELNRQAREFMTFPPKIYNGKQNKNQHNVEGFGESRQGIREGHSCDR